MGADAAPARYARRAAIWAVVVLGGCLLFFLYWRQSSFQPANADGASIALEAWDIRHGNVLLHGWRLADVSFYTTELPQYLLIELVLGLGPWVVHAAGAMTYTLLVLLAALLARGRATGRQGVTRALLAGGIIVSPQLSATSTLLLGPAHAGTAVPLLATWLLIDRAPRRWYVPAGVCLILAWALVADSLVLVAGIAPLVIACLVRALPSWRKPPRYEIALAAAGAGAAVLGWLLRWGVQAAGGYSAQPVSTRMVTAGELPRSAWVTVRAVLEIFGANVLSAGQGFSLAFAFLHLAGVVLVIAGLVIAFARFGRTGEVVVPVLALGIVLNLLAFLTSRMGLDIAATREIAPVMPYGAALAGRLTAGPHLRMRLAPRLAPLTAPLLTPLLAALACGYLAALGYAATWPSAPPADQQLAAWLTAQVLTTQGLTTQGLATQGLATQGLATHQLTTQGLANYWDANSTTLDTGGRIQVSSVQVNHGKIVPGDWETVARAYDPARYDARFLAVRDKTVTPAVLAAARSTFGPPVRTYRIPGYTIYVWSANLLSKLGPPPPLSALAASSQQPMPSGYTKYPQRVAGASVNSRVRISARYPAAAGAVRGGRQRMATAIPAEAVAMRPITARCPAYPVAASRCPGSGLAAGECAAVRPSGNAIVFATRAPGWTTRNGPTMTASTAAAAPANLTAARPPSRAANKTPATSRAGQAVAFSVAAAPSTTPAAIAESGRAVSAKPRQRSPTTGRSLPLTASGKAISGVPASTAVFRTGSATRATRATRSAAQNETRNTTPSHTRGSVATPPPNNARARPNAAMPGRYGL